MKKIQKNKKLRRGQGMTEYIIIVALIAIAAIGVVTLFGNNIQHLFNMSTEALHGTANVENTTHARDDALQDKTLQNFGQNNTPGGGGGAP